MHKNIIKQYILHPEQLKLSIALELEFAIFYLSSLLICSRSVNMCIAK